MFERSSEVSVLKTRIKLLEQRKQHLLAALRVEENTHDHYFSHSELERIACQLQEAKLELARKTGEKGT
jgi:hypothetical protein